MTFAIIGAMDYETELLRQQMTIEAIKCIAGLEFAVGMLVGHPVVVVTCGIGKVNAALCTQILITHFKVDHVINTGVAGAIADVLEVGDIVISTDLIQHDVDATGFGYELGEIPKTKPWIFEADKDLVDKAFEASSKEVLNHKIYKGRIVSGDQFISSSEQKRRIEHHFKPYAAEMEGASIAQVCMLNKVPFVVIRAMSDKADGSAHVTFETFAREAAINSSQIVMHLLKLN